MPKSIGLAHARENSIRETIASAAVATPSKAQREIILSLKRERVLETVKWFEKWKSGGIFLHHDPSGVVTPGLLTGGEDSFATVGLLVGTPLPAADGSAIQDSAIGQKVEKLGALNSLAAQDTIKTILAEAKAAKDAQTVQAATRAITAIESHVSRINAAGTLFRGILLGSV